MEDVDPCISQVVDLIEDAHRKSSPSAPVILNFDPAVPLVRIQVFLLVVCTLGCMKCFVCRSCLFLYVCARKYASCDTSFF